VAAIGAAGALLNLIFLLQIRNAVGDMRQNILDRVDEKLGDYQLTDVCQAKMDAVRAHR
jgi:hypothetical protein